MLDLGINIFVALLAAAAAALYEIIKKKYFFRPHARKIFSFQPGEATSLVIPTVGNEEFNKVELINLTTPLESVYTSSALSRYIPGVIGTKAAFDVHLSAELPPNILLNNLIVIGGPVHNDITRRFFENTDASLYFDGYDMASKHSQKKYAATIKDDQIATDYAMIISAQNPWNPERSLVLICACRGYGAIAAVEFLIKNGITSIEEHIGARIDRKKSKFAVISTEIDHLPTGQFQLRGVALREAFQE